jgi:hypothetical protein
MRPWLPLNTLLLKNTRRLMLVGLLLTAQLLAHIHLVGHVDGDAAEVCEFCILATQLDHATAADLASAAPLPAVRCAAAFQLCAIARRFSVFYRMRAPPSIPSMT